MSTQIFLYLDIMGGAIKGEATAAGYEDEIEIDSFSWDLQATPTVREDKSRGKPAMSYGKVSISKPYDSASVNLSRSLSRGARFNQARLSVDHHAVFVAKSGGDKKKANPMMVLKLSDGYVESVRLDASESGGGVSLKETIELSYSSYTVMYSPAGEDRVKRKAQMIFEGKRRSDKI